MRGRKQEGSLKGRNKREGCEREEIRGKDVRGRKQEGKEKRERKQEGRM